MLLPYSISIDETGIATFTADNKAIYKALFVGIPSPEPQLEGLIFDFTFERDASKCGNPKHPGHDGRVRPTLEKIINRFFELAPDGILYFSCDSTDGRHRERLSIFDKWYTPHQAEVTKVPFCIPGGEADSGEELPDTIGGAFFLKSHPFHEMVEAFIKSEIIVYTSVKMVS
jgi:hypothetical protein